MSNDATAPAEREEIEMLLPWYVSAGSMPATAPASRSYLARDAGMRHQLDLIRAEQQETIAANEALRTPSAGALDRLMASLPHHQPSPRRAHHHEQRLSSGGGLLRRTDSARRTPGGCPLPQRCCSCRRP
jgi:hypothetical protein